MRHLGEMDTNRGELFLKSAYNMLQSPQRNSLDAMILSEVIAVLRDRGMEATARMIHHAQQTSRVHSPLKDASGRFEYEERHINELDRYFRTDRPRGRPIGWRKK